MAGTAEHRITFPTGFDGYAWEAEAKGWLPDILVTFGGRPYRVTFYDPVRLAQDIEAQLQASAAFFRRNVIVVPSVSRVAIEAAVAELAETGAFVDLAPEGDASLHG